VREKIRLIEGARETMAFLTEYLEAQRQPAVLLASGDPLFFGIGRLALSQFGAGRVEILPDLSCLQMAFAAIKMPWDEALLLSFHGGPEVAKRRPLPWGPEDLPYLIRHHTRIAILTDGINHPGVIAQALKGVAGVRLHVAMRLAYPEEQVISGTPEEIARGSYALPNLVIVERIPGGPPEASGPFGLREGELEYEEGLITKDEVRAVSLHSLKLPVRGVFWDVGAGSGAVAIEAAKLCPGLSIYAVEAEAKRVEAIQRNRARHGAVHLKVVSGQAPEALDPLPSPDRVFVGGSGGRLNEILAHVIKRATPQVVVNAATWETLTGATAALEEGGYLVEVKSISVARLRSLGPGRGFAAQNPVFVITARRPS
jgi:precorrin-6Y C5,15-methyltransferase (decarboxylating)